jgi:hypothetical protein
VTDGDADAGGHRGEHPAGEFAALRIGRRLGYRPVLIGLGISVSGGLVVVRGAVRAGNSLDVVGDFGEPCGDGLAVPDP